ncbi:general secretion pathway protein D [Aeromonas salmonicida]|nr:general secretion pathway protein D [Aeromonas salmonicida]
MAAGFYHGNWAALVTALSTNTKSDILSTPSIVTMDNKEASFNVGQEVPVQSGSQSSTTSDQVFNTIERKTVGTKLTVTPQINEGDSVLLKYRAGGLQCRAETGYRYGYLGSHLRYPHHQECPCWSKVAKPWCLAV